MSAERVTGERDRPYRPSWVDRLGRWVAGLPLPAWAFYLGLGLGLLLLALAALWVSGIEPAGTILFYYALSAFTPAYFLALIYYLDVFASAALARFRPVLTGDDAEYARLHREFTTMPARPALIACLLGALYALATLLVNVATGVNPSPWLLPPGVVALDIAYRLLYFAMAALMAYHTIHQLRIVSRIYTRHTRINLFQLGPLYALSNLTAATAIGIAIPTWLWFWLISSASRARYVSDVLPSLFFGTIIAVTFVWPLLGAHRLLVREKQRLQDEVGRRMESTIAALNEAVDADETGGAAGALTNMLNGLIVEQGVINKLRTWPWQPGTVGGVGIAYLAPLIIWLLQRVLERLGV